MNRIDFSRMKSVFILFIIAGVILFILGVDQKIPDDDIFDEYLGKSNDIYIIEASIRGGEIAGAKTQQAVYICFGTTLFLVGLAGTLSIRSSDPEERTVCPKNLKANDKSTHCPKCGAEIEESADECPECGAELKEDEET